MRSVEFEHRLGHGGAPGAQRHVAGQTQQHGGVLAHAIHRHQLVRRGAQHPLHGAELPHQPVRRLVGILPRYGEKQQQLQQLMVVHSLGACRQIAPLAALPVSIVQAHADSSFVYGQGRQLSCLSRKISMV